MAAKRYKIAMVDDNMATLTIGKNILNTDFEVFPILSGEQLLLFLERVVPDLILLDIEMPDMDGYAVIQQIKKDARLKAIPVIFLTARDDRESELEGFEYGAVDYVSKPFRAQLLRKRIQNQILISEQRKKLQHYNLCLKTAVDRKTKQVYTLQAAMLTTVTDMVEFRDKNTGGHIDRTQRYLKLLVDEMRRQRLYADLTKDWNDELLIESAPLHDVGKIAISDAILNKPGALTEAEFEIMKTHVEIGVKVVRRIAESAGDNKFLRFARIVVGTHHEKWDGTGYPNGFSENSIPLEGRLMAIADVYDALRSDRPYKKAFSEQSAKDIMLAGAGSHFDPKLIEIFSRVEEEFAKISRGKR